MKNIMALDCEYNQPSGKTIQIGAAIYDIRTTECIETFETYVNPNEPVIDRITELTGIRDQDVRGAPNILEAYNMLKEFHKKYKVFCNPLVWGSGTRNDSQIIHEESGIQEDNFMGRRVIDAKTLYVSLKLFDGGEYAGGLEKCMKKLGLTFQGTAHTALADAKNTFIIWHHLTKKLSIGHNLK